MRITPNTVSQIVDHFDEEKTQELLQAMQVELRRCVRNRRYHRDVLPVAECLEDMIMSPDFWMQMDIMLNDFSFEP